MEQGEVGPDHLTFETCSDQADERPQRHCAEGYKGRDPYRAVQVLSSACGRAQAILHRAGTLSILSVRG